MTMTLEGLKEYVDNWSIGHVDKAVMDKLLEKFYERTDPRIIFSANTKPAPIHYMHLNFIPTREDISEFSGLKVICTDHFNPRLFRVIKTDDPYYLRVIGINNETLSTRKILL